MSSNSRDLINGYLDDVLTADQFAELNAWLKADPANAQAFAGSSLLHDRLHNVLAAKQDEERSIAEVEAAQVYGLPRRIFSSVAFWRAAASIAFLALGFGLLWSSFGQSNALAAFRELDRIIETSLQSKDRTFEILVESVTTPAPRRRQPATQESLRPPKPPLDRAILHLRDSDRFVLIRQTIDGLPFVTGSNGTESWAVNARGPVKTSPDVHHFDRDLPGHETAVPLNNLHDGLSRLRQSYSLQFLTPGPEEFAEQPSESVRVLVAVKHPNERGPQRVEIAYDSATGRILHVRFIQMPYGPDRLDLRLSLLHERELPPEFFEHTSHHTADRRVEIEN